VKRLIPLTIAAVVFIPVAVLAQKPEAVQANGRTQAEPSQQPKAPSPPAASEEKAGQDKDEKPIGFALPNTDRMRVWMSVMAGYTFDPAQASLGFEKQGRPGYAIIGIVGRLNDHVRYRLVINPVTESQPLPSCGEENFFYPNTPQNLGPNVACDNNGRTRVDDYRFIALDPLMQSGPIREAYLNYTQGLFGLKAGRFILPVGFGWEEAGSFTAKDATHIQRINTEASFGFQVSLTKNVRHRRFASVSLAGILGDGNKFRDYDYVYFLEGSLDSNSWPTMVASGSVVPLQNLEFRAAVKRGHTGSKVERLPNLFASKRNDHAIVLSAQYRPITHVRVFGESASYTWGLLASSAALLGMPSLTPIEKNGYYYGAEASYPVRRGVTVGANVTREELSRDDTLIQWLASQNLYGVTMGKKERSTSVRFYADVANAVRIGVFRNDLSNPFPWVSGIAPVSGPRAYQSRTGSKWGVVLRFTLQ